MNGDEIAAHPYYQALTAVRIRTPKVEDHRPFWTRVLREHDERVARIDRLTAERDSARGHLAGAQADLRIRGDELAAARQELDLARRPVPVGGGTARPLTLSAQDALRVALTRPQSELEPRVLFPGECSQAVVEELIDHDLAELHGPTMQQFESGDWWHLTIAEARLTPLALTVRLDPEPNDG